MNPDLWSVFLAGFVGGFAGAAIRDVMRALRRRRNEKGRL